MSDSDEARLLRARSRTEDLRPTDDFTDHVLCRIELEDRLERFADQTAQLDVADSFTDALMARVEEIASVSAMASADGVGDPFDVRIAELGEATDSLDPGPRFTDALMLQLSDLSSPAGGEERREGPAVSNPTISSPPSSAFVRVGRIALVACAIAAAACVVLSLSAERDLDTSAIQSSVSIEVPE